MKIKQQIAIENCLLASVSSLIFIIMNHYTPKISLLQGIDSKLLAAAHFTRAILPEDYHDSVQNKTSISREDYLKIVDKYDKREP